LGDKVIVKGEVSGREKIWEITIFLETPVTIFARCSADQPLGDKVIVKGEVSGREKIWEINVQDSDQPGPPLPIRDRCPGLGSTRAPASDPLGKREDKGPGGIRGRLLPVRITAKDRKLERVKDTVIQLSKRYGILSQSTSYVAIEERQEKDKTTGGILSQSTSYVAIEERQEKDKTTGHG